MYDVVLFHWLVLNRDCCLGTTKKAFSGNRYPFPRKIVGCGLEATTRGAEYNSDNECVLNMRYQERIRTGD